jgi:cytochrome c biogenesis protein
MMPVEQNGRLFFISGMRENISEEYSYLQVPADPKGGIERFMRFMAVLHDPQKVDQVAVQIARESVAGSVGEQQLKVQQTLKTVMTRLLGIFNQGGFDAVARYFQASLPKAQLKQAAEAYAGLLQKSLNLLYAEVLAEEGVKVAGGNAELENRQFFEDAVNAMGVIPQYGSVYYLQLTGFDHIQASGLQITRAPGKNVVYIGFGMLIIGVFLMFYLPHRRLWVWLKQDGEATQVLFAGTSQRDQIGFAKEFGILQQSLEARLKAL